MLVIFLLTIQLFPLFPMCVFSLSQFYTKHHTFSLDTHVYSNLMIYLRLRSLYGYVCAIETVILPLYVATVCPWPYHLRIIESVHTENYLVDISN